MYQYRDYLPEILRDSREYRAIGAAVDGQAAVLAARQPKLLTERRIGSASGAIASRWERVLALETNPALTLEERRYRILTSIRLRAVVTLRKLQEELDRITDQGATVHIDYDRYILTVQLGIKSRHNHSTVDRILRETMPANLVIIIVQLYNRWADYRGITWGGLTGKTWRQMREEAIR